MARSDDRALEAGRIQLRRLGTLSDCVYAVALIAIMEWLPLPTESAAGGEGVLLRELFVEFGGNLVSVGIALAFLIIYWLRSNARTALVDRTDTVHSSLTIASLFFLLILLYVVRVSAEIEGSSSRASESLAVALIGLPLAAAWWHADRKGLIRQGITDKEKKDEFTEAFTEPITALLTLPFAYVGELYWNLAWLAYLPVSWLLKRRSARRAA